MAEEGEKRKSKPLTFAGKLFEKGLGPGIDSLTPEFLFTPCFFAF